jgi:hypothetical protein
MPGLIYKYGVLKKPIFARFFPPGAAVLKRFSSTPTAHQTA